MSRNFLSPINEQVRDGDEIADKEVNTPGESKRRNSKAHQSDIEGERETLIIDASGSPLGRK